MANVTRWDPFEDNLDDLFRGVFLRPMRLEQAQDPVRVRMDVKEDDKAYVVHAEIPGVKKEAIQVSVYENTVTVSAQAAAPEDEGAQWLLRERGYGRFSRTIALPEAVDDEASQARYSDGVLTLTLKKKSASRQKPHSPS